MIAIIRHFLSLLFLKRGCLFFTHSLFPLFFSIVTEETWLTTLMVSSVCLLIFFLPWELFWVVQEKKLSTQRGQFTGFEWEVYEKNLKHWMKWHEIFLSEFPYIFLHAYRISKLPRTRRWPQTFHFKTK